MEPTQDWRFLKNPKSDVAVDALRIQAQIIDQIHDAVVLTDLNGFVTSWNQGAQRLFGYTSGEAVGRHISFVYPEEMHQFLQDEVIAPLLRKSEHQIEARLLTKSGDDFYAHLSLSLLRDSKGKTVGMIGYSMDITDRIIAQKELETRARQQRVVAELSQMALADYPIEDLMTQAASRVADTLQVEYSKILEIIPGESELLLRAGVGWKEGYVGRARVDASLNSQAGYTLVVNEPVIVLDLATESRFSGPPLLLEHGVVSGMSVIIKQQGQPYGILGVHTRQKRRFTEDDIHFIQSVANLLALALERKRIEERLAYQADLLANVHEAILATDENLIITAWNKAAEQLYGWRMEEVLGRPVQEIFRKAAVQESWMTEALETLAEKDSLDYELVRPREDGTPLYIDGKTIALYDASGDLRGYVSTNRDVSKRKKAEMALKKSEERFRQLSENIQEIFWMTSADGQELLYVSPAFETITGRSVKEVYDSQSWLQIIHPEDFEKVASASQADSLAGGRFDLTYRVLRPDGDIRWIKDRGFPVRDETGQIYRIAGIAVDITSQVRYEENLRQLSRQVVSVQEYERRRISHELHDEAGQALTALKIELELLQLDLSGQPESVHQALKEAMGLIEKTMANIHTLAYQLRPPELDSLGLSPVLEDLCRTFSLRTHIPTQYHGVELPELSDSEAVCLYRLAQEALTNVAKHAQASHVQMKLNYDAESHYLIVEDDGQGFDKMPEYSNLNQHPRLGILGMRERVELFDGSLEVDSRPGQGTRLTAKIPRR